LMDLLKEYFPDSIIKIYEDKIFIVADYIEAGCFRSFVQDRTKFRVSGNDSR